MGAWLGLAAEGRPLAVAVEMGSDRVLDLLCRVTGPLLLVYLPCKGETVTSAALFGCLAGAKAPSTVPGPTHPSLIAHVILVTCQCQ